MQNLHLICYCLLLCFACFDMRGFIRHVLICPSHTELFRSQIAFVACWTLCTNSPVTILDAQRRLAPSASALPLAREPRMPPAASCPPKFYHTVDLTSKQPPNTSFRISRTLPIAGTPQPYRGKFERVGIAWHPDKQAHAARA